MTQKSQLDDVAIKARYIRGESTVAIGKSLGVSYQTIYRRLLAAGVEIRPSIFGRGGCHSHSLSSLYPSPAIKQAERRIIGVLLDGNRYTAKAIQDRIGSGYIWEVLMYLEKEGRVYRAAVHGDWRTFNSWKITGCGRLFASIKGA